MQRFSATLGKAIRETGQALDRLGASRVFSPPIVTKAPTALNACLSLPFTAGLDILEKPVYKEFFSRHRNVSNLFSK